MTIPYLGPGASILLGLMNDTTTTDELYERVRDVLELNCLEEMDAVASAVAGFVGGSARLTLTRIMDGGTDEVVRLLERLAEFGFVDRLADPFGGDLWSRRRVTA